MRYLVAMLMFSILSGCATPGPHPDWRYAAVLAVEKVRDSEQGCRLRVTVWNNTEHEVSGVVTQITLLKQDGQTASQVRIASPDDTYMPPGEAATLSVYPTPVTACDDFSEVRFGSFTFVTDKGGNLVLEDRDVRVYLDSPDQ